MEQEHYKAYSKKYYAGLKKVSPPRISKLVKEKKLDTRIEEGIEKVIDCPWNDKLFENPAHNRKLS